MAADRAQLLRTHAAFYVLVAVVGALAGLLATLFHLTLDHLHDRHALFSELAAWITLPGWLVAPTVVAVCVGLANWLVRRFAAGTAGSGIPAVLETLRGREPASWARVLPVQIISGLLALGSGLVLGREGPLVHMGSAAGAMVSRCMPIDPARRRTLIMSGAAAGLAAALNAPLAGVVFILEELRSEFDSRIHSLQAAILAIVVATAVSAGFFGQGPVIDVPEFPAPPVSHLGLCVVLGALVGALGVAFNWALVTGLRCFEGLPQRRPWPWSLGMGAMIGLMTWFMPAAVGSGEQILLTDLTAPPVIGVMAGLILLRTALLVASYSTGVPGGLYAPLLALGTLIGLSYGEGVATALPGVGIEPAVYAIAAMGALFAASVRAPLTGIAIVVEMTGNFDLILAIMVTAVTATLVAEALRGRPIFEVLARTAHTEYGCRAM